MTTTVPAEIHRAFEQAFNAGDLDALVALYEPDAALIPQPGTVVHGKEQIGAALQASLDLGGTISLDTKEVVEVGDLAFLVNRWSLTGTGPDGGALDMGGAHRGSRPAAVRRDLAVRDRQRLGRSRGGRVTPAP